VVEVELSANDADPTEVGAVKLIAWLNGAGSELVDTLTFAVATVEVLLTLLTVTTMLSPALAPYAYIPMTALLFVAEPPTIDSVTDSQVND
jgi:hypothetical protein